MMQNQLTAKRPVAAVGEEIDHMLGAKFISDYQKLYPNETAGYLIGKEIIEKILAQPGCVGIRFYSALNEMGEKTLVYVGVGENREDIVEYTVISSEGNITSQKAIVADRTERDSPEPWWKIFKFW